MNFLFSDSKANIIKMNESKSKNNNQASACKSEQLSRPIKRRRSSSEDETKFPDNILETEKNLHASAVKNNLDETSVRKIIKKVVANERVLAMVKFREKEEKELTSNSATMHTKLTRSKTKELMKVSPKIATYPRNLKLSPIKHIPVKTRPEVKALIAQDLPEDEDDDEYEPTQEDVPSDDEQTLESCSDLDSQPRTPATPRNLDSPSPQIVQDGPFKVPQNMSAAKRKLDLEEEEATIARRTRSKLSLSSTSIEHIESTFVPPDDIPMPDVDDLWNQFLNECLNPASTSKHEDDDEADPEYNVAADPDAADEDEENLSNSIIKISKKELNDLVTELCAVMPVTSCNEDLAEKLVNSVLTETSQSEITRWEGKQEPVSDDEASDKTADRTQHEKSNTFVNISFGGKTESVDDDHNKDTNIEKTEVNLTKNEENINNNVECTKINDKRGNRNEGDKNDDTIKNSKAKGESIEEMDKMNDKSVKTGDSDETTVVIEIIKDEDKRNNTETNVSSVVKMSATSVEQVTPAPPDGSAPPVIQKVMEAKQPDPVTHVMLVKVQPGLTVLPEQIQIIQQQLRQHIQLATSHFLQLFVHPIHWSYASYYKDYVESFVKMCNTNSKSVANVCNLKPALELITSWETNMKVDIPENKEMVKFILAESEKCRHRNMNHTMTPGEFPEQMKRVVANSGVFLYPHLLPLTPFRPDHIKRFSYIASEDKLIALGLQEFWDYVESNKKLFKSRALRAAAGRRAGLTLAVEQLVHCMLPWMAPRHVMLHVQHVRKHGHSENPIKKFLKTNKVDPVQHKLLPFNPQMTLYEHPESEIPRPWVRYLAKTSNRFKKCLPRTDHIIHPTTGVPVEIGKLAEVPKKNPLPIDFNQKVSNELPSVTLQDKFDVNVTNSPKEPLVATNLFSVVQTSTGMVLVPLVVQNTNVVDSQPGPVTTPAEVPSNVELNARVTDKQNTVTVEVIDKVGNKSSTENDDKDHCECCITLRRILSKGQRLITNYFKPTKPVPKQCYCKDRKYPKVSKRLKLFLKIYKSHRFMMLRELEHMLKDEAKVTRNDFDANDLEYAVLFQMRLITCLSLKVNHKKRIHKLFSDYNVDVDDPIQLVEKFEKKFKSDLHDLCIDFLGFLTAEQAESYGVFNHYLVTYMDGLMKKISEYVTDMDRRKSTLEKLKKLFNNSNKLTPCQICMNLLSELSEYPQLAKYVCSLFPHKICTPHSHTPHNHITVEPISTNDETAVPLDVPSSTNQEEHLSSGEGENSEPGPIIIETFSECQMELEVVKEEPTSASDEESNNVELITPNSDSTDDSRQSHDNMVIAEEENKSENQDWSREDDKVLLEVIKKYLATEETKNKSIFKTLQENKVYELISERITDKSMDDIVQRVLYLLEVLVVNDS